MDKRRKIMKSTPEYNELNEVIRKKTRNYVRQHNTKLIKTLIENNKNMKLFKTINTRGQEYNNLTFLQDIILKKDSEITRNALQEIP